MKKSRLNIFLTRNPWLKLASLILAAGMWFFVMSKGRSVIVVDVPISFKNVPATSLVVNGEKKVSVSIEGQSTILKNLNTRNVSVTVDLNDVREGPSTFSLSESDVSLPKGLSVSDISPGNIKLVIEDKISKDVQIRPVIIGTPAEGYRVWNIGTVPKKVKIEGPRSVVKKVFTVRTDPIDVTGITSDLKYIARLDAGYENIMMVVSEAEVNISIIKVK